MRLREFTGARDEFLLAVSSSAVEGLCRRSAPQIEAKLTLRENCAPTVSSDATTSMCAYELFVKAVRIGVKIARPTIGTANGADLHRISSANFANSFRLARTFSRVMTLPLWPGICSTEALKSTTS